MKTSIFVVIVIVFQAVHSGTVVETTRDDLNAAFGYCRSSLELNQARIFTVSQRFLLPEHDADLQKLYKCVAREMRMIDSNDNYKLSAIENVAEAMIAKITNQVPEESRIRYTAESAVEHCKDTPKQNDVGITIIQLSNCIRSYAATHLSF